MKKQVTGTVITVLFSLLGIISAALWLSSGSSSQGLDTIILFFQATVIIVYTLWDYKIPHSNVFKYVMLFFALSMATSVYFYAETGVPMVSVMYAVIMALTGYMAGRLDRIKKNYIIMSLILVLLLVKFICNIVDFPTEAQLAELSITAPLFVIRSLSSIFMWLSLCAAYITCFKGHKQAGSEVPAKKK